MRRTRTTNKQDAENGFLRRSYFAQALDVPTKSCSGFRSLRPCRETVLSILRDAQHVYRNRFGEYFAGYSGKSP